MAKSEVEAPQVVVVDLRNPGFVADLTKQNAAALKEIRETIDAINGVEWSHVYKSKGFKWEAVDWIKTPTGSKAYSVRLSKKIRAVVYRDGAFMRFLTLHPDHDSAYKKKKTPRKTSR